MTAEPHTLSDCIEIGGRFLRSVNLEKDFPADSQNGEYVVTPTARQILSQLADGLGDRSTNRAWTVTGPYGVGKSSFGVFVTRLLCSQGSAGTSAVRKLKEVDPIRGHEFERLRRGHNGRKLMFPVLITARRSAGKCLSPRGHHLGVCRIEGPGVGPSRCQGRVIIEGDQEGCDSRYA